MELEQLKTDLKNITLIAFDTETMGLVDKTLVGFSIAYEKDGQIIAEYYPVSHKYIENVDPDKARSFLKWLFTESNITMIMHNAVFDLEVMENYQIDTSKTLVEDTMILAHLLDERYLCNLKDTVLREFGYQMIHFKEICGSGQKAITFDLVQDKEIIYKYGSEDAYYAYKLFKEYAPRIKENKKLLKIYSKIERPLIKVVLDMHMTGVRVDLDQVKKIKSYCQDQVDFVKSKLDILMPGINLNSSKQLAEYFISQKGLEPLKYSYKTGAPSVDADFFKHYRGHYKVKAEIDAILAYRKYNKILSTFVPAITPKNGDRIYPKFRQIGTVSGRFSSSEPNGQNIPRTEEADPEDLDIRSAFIPDDTHIFIGADYSQIEIRIAAFLSEDPALVEAFTLAARNSKYDMHKETGKVCGCSRQHAKTLNFGLLYGMRERALARNLGVSEPEARVYWSKWWHMHKRLDEFLREKEQEIRTKGEVYTWFGRRRLLMTGFYTLKEDWKRAAHLRSVSNSIIQGTGADIIKFAMVIMHPKLKDLGAKIVLTVHDEVLVSVPTKNLAQQCADIIYKAMTKAAEPCKLKSGESFPFEVVLYMGKTWQEAHGTNGIRLLPSEVPKINRDIQC